MSAVHPGADQRHQEKLRARAEGRAPVIVQPVVVPQGASADERYRAKLAARQLAKSQPTAPADPKADAKSETKSEAKDNKSEPKDESKGAAPADPKADAKGNKPSK